MAMTTTRKSQTPADTSRSTYERESDELARSKKLIAYFVSPESPPRTAWAAERRAIGTRKGEQLT
jgi:hypothetical protein